MDATLDTIRLAVAIAAGLLVLAVSSHVLRHHSPFRGPAALTVAFCMSALTALALLREVPVPVSDRQPEPSTSHPGVSFILLPYAALGLTLLLLPLLLWLRRWRTRGDAQGVESSTARDPLEQYVDAIQNAWTQVTRPPTRNPDPTHSESRTHLTNHQAPIPEHDPE